MLCWVSRSARQLTDKSARSSYLQHHSSSLVAVTDKHLAAALLDIPSHIDAKYPKNNIFLKTSTTHYIFVWKKWTNKKSWCWWKTNVISFPQTHQCLHNHGLSSHLCNPHLLQITILIRPRRLPQCSLLKIMGTNFLRYAKYEITLSISKVLVASLVSP